MNSCVFKDVVIIGGGPAGMAVADRLFDLGIKDIILFEKESYLGGVLPQCIHDGFGLIKFAENLSGPEYSAIYTNRLKEKNIDVRLCSTVMEISYKKSPATAGEFPVAFHTSVSCISKNDLSNDFYAPGGTMKIKTRAIVLASGCREKNRSNMYIPGTRPDGIFTAGTSQAFVNLHDLMPGSEAVILGSGDIGLIMARRLTLEGCHVKCVAEIDSVSGGLKRNIKQCLSDYDIPLLLNSTVTKIFGFPRITAVEICNVEHDEVNSTFTIRKDTARKISCDTLILSAGLLPENSLIQNLDSGFSSSFSGDFSIDPSSKISGDFSGDSSSKISGDFSIDPSSKISGDFSGYPSTVPSWKDGIFLCGNALFVHGLVDDVSQSGENVAEDVFEWLQKGVSNSRYSLSRADDARAENMEILRSKRLETIANAHKNTITCILCPNSCEIDENLKGGKCPKGAEYALEEMRSPKRILTSSIKIKDEDALVSVRTKTPIPKEMLPEAVKKLRQMTVPPPVKCGDLICSDFMLPGIDLIATRNFPL